MVLIVDQDELVARPRVGEADAARARAIGDSPHRAVLPELGAGEMKQRRECFGRQAANAKVHDVLLDD